MMHPRLMALPTLGALFALSVGPAPAATASPKPAATPLKTISHVYAKRLCTGLRRSIAPAVGHVLQNDRLIATSRPLFVRYTKNTSEGTQAATDMDIMQLENLVTPLVKNTQAIERLLNDTVYPRHPQSDEDRQLLAMRAHLEAVLEQQKRALDLVNGLVDTQNMAELQAAGHDYDNAISGNDANHSTTKNTQTPAPLSPTAAPAPILNAGVSQQNDPARKYDPRYINTGSQVGYNPLNAFDEQMENYQQNILVSENKVTAEIFKAIPECGGKVPAQPSPAPLPASPAPAAPVAAPSPSAKP